MPRKSVEPPNATATKKQKPPGGVLQTRVPHTTNRRCWTAGIRNRLDSVSTVQLQHHNIYLTSLYYVDMYLSVYRSRINPGSPGIILNAIEKLPQNFFLCVRAKSFNSAKHEIYILTFLHGKTFKFQNFFLP